MLLDEGDAETYEKHFAFDSDLVQPVFAKKGAPYEAGVEYIRSTGLKNIVISRADSDDIISDDYIEKVNAEVTRLVEAGQPFDYIVATHGYRTDGDVIQEIYYSCSPYLSLFREEWDGKNIYDINHEDVLQYAYFPIESARWMQCIHGGNLANQFMNGMADRQSFEDSIRNNKKLIAMQRVSAKDNWPENFGVYNLAFPESF
ncbi:Putative rhamnosyl transferase (plasmid) [Salipiger abyssi]|uniref:Putative rhamnosyl transferase n=1 Tax=Salipiger abyssi TaxID=1250539 RepID=A0A1P8V0L5_9RHOB|nr:Putative rhamnosyl transferase [Salipiger abyssi]